VKRVLLVAVALLLVLVAVLALGAYRWAKHDAPIAAGNARGGWNGSLLASQELGNVDEQTFYPRYRPARFRVEVSFVNTGRWTVSVRDVTVPRDGGPQAFRLVRTQVTPENDFTLAHLRPLDRAHPLRLHRHEQRGIVLTYRIVAGCPSGQPGDYLRHLDTLVRITPSRTLDLALHVGPIATTERFELPFALTLACSGRILPAP
jgi:hypothetical protein